VGREPPWKHDPLCIGYGNDFNRIALTTLKTVVLDPIARANVTIAIAPTGGSLRNSRTA